MTEARTDLGTCAMGSKTARPCPFPATVEMRGGYYAICAFHAATEPLVGEVNELGVVVELLRGYLKDAREYTAAESLVTALERIEVDFSGRLRLAEKVLDDLEAAEYRLMR
jgi:hypothetical protein